MTTPEAPSRARSLWLVVSAIALSAFAWWPMIAAYPNTQSGDGPPYQKTLEATRIAVVRFHELPLWNPYECGGLPLWDNPQGPAAAPLAWLIFLTSTTKAMYAWYLLHSAAGFLCMWVFARRDLSLSRAASLVAACAWAFSGFHQQHYSGGHFTFVPFLYFPLAFHLWRKAEREMRAAVLLGLLVAWMMLEGAVYPLPHLAVMLFAETLTRAWPAKRLLPIGRAALVVFAVGFSVAACRFLPVADQLRSHTRGLAVETDAIQWETLKDMFVARSHARPVMGQTYVWPEYGTYFGPILFTLAVIGLLVSGLENAWLVGVFALAFALMLGHAGPYAPWSILKAHVFPFTEMRVPSRFRVEVSMFFAAFIGLAIDRLPRLARRLLGKTRLPDVSGTMRAAMVGIALIGVGDMLGVGITWFQTCFGNPPLAAVQPSTRLYLGGPDMTPSMNDQPRQNRGRLQCWDEWGFGAGAPLWEGDLPQARAADDAVTVEVANRTQNTFTIDVVASRPGRVLVNTSYDRGWRTDVGTTADASKQLAIDVPAGRNRLHVAYWPHGLTAGFLLSALGIAGVIAFFVRRARQRANVAS